ncbi:ADP-ribosylglycohydrolase family protein [Sulfitobacter albidus]|uniref:ADP-ribosylglycohydrolase family protein n=1 Tax=Sulfitobacter albidus TaxID=2829501 RepID=A0A975JD01_9RHOB|nr:ADP-ribosylglycohydrolase family protein [Sulfitobacter albidus]QUJ76092.1 ADP-ribosylglycohydrolase family protein [Sulfitobacter albidus]
MPTRSADMLFGALIADAAALGLHWLYDPARIAEIADRRGGAAFCPVDETQYHDAKGIFVHHARSDGMLSQYGEVLALALRSIATEGAFDATAYRTAFAAHFGAGGSYQGYIDRPTRGALDNIAAERDETGIDDDQLPATATLPAIVARYHGTPDLHAQRRAAMEVTNINPVADAYSAAFVDLLTRLLDGTALADALTATAQAADPAIRDALSDALNTDEDDTVAYAEEVGRACHLPMGGPVIFHILARSPDPRDAVERNIRTGGDSCGRAIPLGAALGAAYGITAFPLDWALRLSDGHALWQSCQKVASA